MGRTQVLKVDPETDYAEAVRRGVDVWRSGGLVAFPTETVYGVGARADLPEAVARLRRVKRRADGKPFTVHIAGRADLERFVPNVGGVGRRMATKGWPGPLTLLFSRVDPAAAPIMRELDPSAAAVIYYQGSVGLRCPDDTTAAELLSGVGAPVVAASANLPGHHPPRTAEQVLAEMDGQIDLLLDAGPARYAKASTVVRVNGQGYQMVREGVYDERALRRLAMLNVLLVCTGNTCRSPMAAALLGKLLARELDVSPDRLEERGVKVSSAGTLAGSGAPPSAEAVEVMDRYGLDIRSHRSQSLSAELINQADFVFHMTRTHRDAVVRMASSAEDRCQLLAEERDIEDPIGQPVEVYAACAESIESALETRLNEVLA